jgi:SHS2 domain-containing protein
MRMAWEHFPHDADIGVRGRGTTLAKAFEETALALTAVVTDPQRVHSTSPVELRCAAPDAELLLVDWLNALIYEMATRRMLFGRFAVTLEGNTLRATAWGEPVDHVRHQPAVEIKGATYTALAVRKAPDGSWEAQCVVDV